LVQIPITLMTIHKGLHALTRKFAEVLISSVATLLVMAVFPYLTKTIVPLGRDSAPLSSIDGGPAKGETDEQMADFMERVALSHVVSLKAPPATAARQAAIVAASEPVMATDVPLPPRPAATPRHDRPSSTKVRIAASVPKASAPAQPPLAASEPATVVTVPVNVESGKAEPLPPLEYGMSLVSNLGNIITASETRVFEGVASMGGTLSSLVKKL
jgi:hypothetical protein